MCVRGAEWGSDAGILREYINILLYIYVHPKTAGRMMMMAKFSQKYVVYV